MDIYEFAEALHSMECRFSHIDQCDWHYRNTDSERWNVKYSTHNTYLNFARNIQEELPHYTFEQIFIVLKGVAEGMVTPYKGRWPS